MQIQAINSRTAARLIQVRPPRIALLLLGVAISAHMLLAVPALPAFPIAGITLGVTGFAIMIRAWWLFKVARTAICPTDTPSALVINDVFRFSRNPMYMGMILMLAAPAVSFGSVPFYLAFVGFAVLLDRVFRPYEEQRLEQEFGARFTEYRQRVRPWL